MDEVRDDADFQKRLKTISKEHRVRAEQLLQSGRKLRALGYWSGTNTPHGLPDPRVFQDETWSQEERNMIIAYLRRGAKFLAYCGMSYCRFDCGEPNMGAHDVTDGVYCWPEGLAHYLEKHSVKLPEEFIAHARNNINVPPPDKNDIDVHILWWLVPDFTWWKVQGISSE